MNKKKQEEPFLESEESKEELEMVKKLWELKTQKITDLRDIL